MKSINQGFGLLGTTPPDDMHSFFTPFQGRAELGMANMYPPACWELEMDPEQNSNTLAHT